MAKNNETRGETITIPPPPPKNWLNDDDVRWMSIVHDTIKGFAAFAEAHAETCETEWMAIHYGLEALAKVVAELLADFEERTEAKP